MVYLWIAVAIAVAAGIAWFVWRRLHSFGSQVAIERVRELFKLQRERLEAQFLQVAAATGKPRGLRWKECQWEDPVEFAREKATGQVHALAGVTIAFEAIEGSDMEGLPAVGNLRNASAVFVFRDGRWQTNGRAVFNMNPDEAIQHLHAQYERIA